MKNARLLLPLVALSLIAADDAGSAKDVEKALQQLNDAFVSRDAAVLKKLMTDDHISITPYAGRESRDEQIDALPKYKIEKYSTEGMKSQALGKNAVLLTYVVKYKGTYAGKALSPRSIASSLWIMHAGKWQEALYQETPVAKE